MGCNCGKAPRVKSPRVPTARQQAAASLKKCPSCRSNMVPRATYWVCHSCGNKVRK